MKYLSPSQTSPFWLCSVSSCRHKKVMLANLSKCSQSWLLQMCFLSLPSCRQQERWTSKEKLSQASNWLAMNLLFPSVYLGAWQMFTYKDLWVGLFRKIWSGIWTMFRIRNISENKLMNRPICRLKSSFKVQNIHLEEGTTNVRITYLS